MGPFLKFEIFPFISSNIRVSMLSHSIDASGNVMETRMLLDIKGKITNFKNGKTIIVTMGKCRFGGSRFNLCSLTKMTDSGWKLSGDDTGMYLEKGEIIIHFDIPITTPKGRIWAIKFKRAGTHNGNAELTLAANPAG